jgi:hypothetical protein
MPLLIGGVFGARLMSGVLSSVLTACVAAGIVEPHDWDEFRAAVLLEKRPMTPQQFDRTRIESFIKDLSEEELRYLNRLIVERLKLIAQEKSTRSLSRFNLGELVKFNDNDGNPKTGRIVRLNKKTASILTSDGQHWKVSPSLLQIAEEK